VTCNLPPRDPAGGDEVTRTEILWDMRLELVGRVAVAVSDGNQIALEKARASSVRSLQSGVST
jgi:hypothetical protein